jgi:DNA-binding protein HU-beta
VVAVVRVLELLGAFLPFRARAHRTRSARSVTDAIAALLVEHGRVAVPGLGLFVVRTRRARRIVTPTGEMIRLPSTPEVRFLAAKKLRARLRDAGWVEKLNAVRTKEAT